IVRQDIGDKDVSCESIGHEGDCHESPGSEGVRDQTCGAQGFCEDSRGIEGGRAQRGGEESRHREGRHQGSRKEVSAACRGKHPCNVPDTRGDADRGERNEGVTVGDARHGERMATVTGIAA
ncbi:MAG TPA: hypothetical protein PLD10_22390, partial [Rhodopila sp.]|nr:hypothetical protein [Rhodopila sp.]